MLRYFVKIKPIWAKLLFTDSNYLKKKKIKKKTRNKISLLESCPIVLSTTNTERSQIQKKSMSI